jgi:hypothetical protein
MQRSLFSAIGVTLVFTFVATWASPAKAQDHVVSPTEIQRDAAGASTARQQRVQHLDSFLSSNGAQQALKSAHMDPKEVKSAVQQLDNEDLAQLSARAEKAQRDFAAGNLSDRDLLIILVAIAALILIIVAVR